MAFRLFTIAAAPGSEGCEELNRFLAGHRVVQVERHCCAGPGAPVWSFCVEYLDGPVPTASAKPAPSRVDYKQVLSEADFAVFARLRELRKRLAERDGVPVYAVLSNDQMASLVTGRVRDRAGMLAIEGIGEGRVRKYGEALLAELAAAGLADPVS